jgi:trigger factor
MSLKATEKVDVNRYALTVEIDAETFAKAVEKVTAKAMKNITIPGFRKGKAPRNMIYKMYGEDVFYQDALEELYPEVADAALNESGIELAEQKVDFELISMDKNGASFKLLVTAKPEVTLGEYKGLKAERAVVKVEDAEIDAELARMQERNARIIAVEGRASELGDTAVIDFEGFVDGVAFEGGKGESYSLELGSGSFIPGFEEQLVGKNAGDDVDVNVTFPEEYHAEELKGKEAVFKCKIHELKSKELPALDDEFAKDVSEFDTLDELKKSISDKIAEGKNAQADGEVENALIQQIVEGMTVEVPDCMVEQRIDDNIRDFENRLRYQGLDLKTYMQYTGMDEKDFREGFRENSLTQVKIRLALEAIAKAENLEASEEDLNAEYAKIADMYKMEADQVKAVIPAKDLASDITANKAIDVVKSSAVVTDAKPAKKTAAKKTTKKAEGEAEEKKPAAKKTTTTKKTTAKKAEGEAAEKKPAAKKSASTAAKKPAAKKAAEPKEEKAE